jgi:signal transduction histidine kinase
LYVAVRARLGTARISMTTTVLRDAIDGAERDVLAGGAVAFLLALVLTWLFAQGVSRPVMELRDLARGISSGDLSRRPRLDAGGELGELAAALDAMAEQLQARLGALQADDALMTAVLASLDEGVIAVDAMGQVVRVNPAARELLGIRAATPFPASELPRERAIREMLDMATRGEPAAAVEVVFGSRTLAVTGRPLTAGGAGQSAGAVLAVLDVTPFRRLEAVRRDFVANVSHELRTPLTALTGSAEILASDDALTTEQRERFGAVVLNSARRMQRLVDDLLDLSRIESGGWVPHPELVDVASVARDVIASAQDDARSKSIALECRVHTAARTLYADPTALHQVLFNLVNNAIRYTLTGGVVSIVSEPAPGGATITVRDTGVGIAPEHLPRIFERFYRADPSRARDAGGTGLGLAIMKHLVEAHGGAVRAESTPNRGTRVSAFFPDAPAA